MVARRLVPVYHHKYHAIFINIYIFVIKLFNFSLHCNPFESYIYQLDMSQFNFLYYNCQHLHTKNSMLPIYTLDIFIKLYFFYTYSKKFHGNCKLNWYDFPLSRPARWHYIVTLIIILNFCMFQDYIYNSIHVYFNLFC